MKRICFAAFLAICGCSSERQPAIPEQPPVSNQSPVSNPAAKAPVAQQTANPRVLLKALVEQAIKRIPMAIPNGFDVFGLQRPFQYIPAENGGRHYWEQKTDTGRDEGSASLQITNYSYNATEQTASITLESYNFHGIYGQIQSTHETFRKYNVTLLFDTSRFVIDKVTMQSKKKSSDSWGDERLCDSDERKAIGQLFPGL